MVPRFDEQLSKLALLRLTENYPLLANRLTDEFGSAGEAIEVLASGAFDMPRPVRQRLTTIHTRNFRQSLGADQSWLKGENRGVLFWGEADYPPLLAQIADPPYGLFYEGDPLKLLAPQIAVVGSRRPTVAGGRLAEKLAAELASVNLQVTSGLAYGIDAAAHRGCLAAGGCSIAVQARGPDDVYPRRHERLLKQIINTGVQVTEFPPGTAATRWNFPRRNRLVTGLSFGTLVVEATIKSGSLISARLAMEQGREVFAVPGSPVNPQSEGCHWLIRQGAKLTTGISDILEEFAGLAAQPVTTQRAVLSGDEQALLALLCDVPMDINSICEQTGISVNELLVRLTQLEIAGQILSGPFGYQRCP